MRVNPIILIWCLGLIVWAPQVWGGEKIVVLASHESPPYTGSRLGNKGGVTEIVTQAFAVSGYRAIIHVIPWKRGLKMTQSGKYDGLFGCWFRKERTQWFIFSSPLVANELIFLTRKGSDIPFNGNYDSLKGYPVGYIRGYATPPGIDRSGALIETVNTNLQNLAKLKKARLNLIIIDRWLSRYLIQQHYAREKEIFQEIDHVLSRDVNYLAFSRKARGIDAKIKAFEQGLARLRQTGRFKAILKESGLR